ncbi:MAG: hypothetical protein V7647_4185 [Acidobacteriota bacterium]
MLAHAWLVVLGMRLGLWFLPWPRLMRVAAPSRVGTRGLTPGRLERAVRLGSRLVPRATCLTQALALNHLLARHGHASTVQIGVRKSQGRFAAHAWVECSGGTLLSSAPEVTAYSRVMTWPPRIT